MSWLQRFSLLQLWLDQQRFRKNQADYFSYLSVLLKNSQGQLTLRSVFDADRKRYGLGHYRGRLAQQWLISYEQNGGSVATTWRAVLSPSAWLLLQSSQAQGDQALLDALALLATQQQQSQRLQATIRQLLWPVIAVSGLLVLVGWLIPSFTVPQLLHTFYAVPAHSYGPKTRALFAWADWSTHYAPVLGLFVIFLGLGVVYSLTRFTGQSRRLLDHIEPWRSYKQIQAAHLLALVALLLNNSSAPMRLAEAIQRVGQHATPWLASQVQDIQQRILQGQVGAQSFATGLLAQETQWYLEDTEHSQGIAVALQLSQQRLYEQLQKQLLLKAQVGRWCLLLGGVLALLAIGGWHYLVIDELRRALLMLYTH